MDATITSLWESVHPLCKGTPKSSWQPYEGSVNVVVDDEGCTLSVLIGGQGLADVRLDADTTAALIAALQNN